MASRTLVAMESAVSVLVKLIRRFAAFDTPLLSNS
jgi:hypothetical protein